MKNLNLILRGDKDYKELVDSCLDILSERRFDLAIRDIEWRWELGKIIKESIVYQKSAKEELIRVLLNRLSKDLKLSVGSLYHCIRFVEVFPDFKEVLKLNTGKKIIKWTDVRNRLFDKIKCNHDETYQEILEIKRIKCKRCDKTIQEEKIKK